MPEDRSDFSPCQLLDEEVYSAVRGYLIHVAQQYLDDDLLAKGGASDLVQTALVAAHKARHQFRGHSPQELRGWLRQILVNCVRKFRRHWYRCEACSVLREVPLEDHGATTPDPVQHGTPSSLVGHQEQYERLAAALACLPPEQQRVITLRMDESLSFVEIGARLGRSPDAVRMLHNRALAQLQRLLLVDPD